MPRQRKAGAWAGQDAVEGDSLARVLRNISGDKLRAILKRDRAYTFRLSEMDRESMDRVAKALEIPTSEYLIRLHYAAYEELRKAGIID